MLDQVIFVGELKEYAVIEYNEGVFTEDYYGLIIQKEWLRAPGLVNGKC